ncbi:hypothetical protein BDV06DRAFT_208704 [Aspergillus oleicola]
MPTILITVCSRGLGLELVRQYSADVIARLNGSAAFVVLDVADKSQVAKAAQEVWGVLDGRPLNILINFAGVFADDLEFRFSVNVTGAHNMIHEFIPLMQDSKIKKVANVLSIYASMVLASNTTYARHPAYKISKAALDFLTVYAMGGTNADLAVPQGAEAVRHIVASVDQKENGCFKNIHVPGWDQYNGKDLPW